MPRAIWTGTISFGLLNVPVKLYSATAKRSIGFRELRASDGSRVRHKRVAEADEKEVPYDEIVKGYELAPDQYVVLSKPELEALDPKKTREIKIEDFVDIDQIDPIYFDQPYYLGPAEGAERAYKLLVEAMRDRGKVAISRFVLRNKEKLAAIRPIGPALGIATMRFSDEVLSPQEISDVLPDEDVEIEKRELEMAEQLIDSLANSFDPDDYSDEHREALLALIEQKAQGKEVVAPDAEEPKPTRAPDLMAALEESLSAVQGSDFGGEGKAKKGGAKTKQKSSRSKSSSDSKSSKSSKSSSKKSGSSGGSKRRSKAKSEK